jgi:predicted glycogen debranching enzyme
MAVVNVSGLKIEELLAREWLVVNHIGGFASSTPLGLNTRKYHGLLIAAMSPPVRRMVILSRVEETIVIGSRSQPLSSSEYPGIIHPSGHDKLRAFGSVPFPRWAFQDDGWTLQKELHLIEGSNTVCLTYTLLGGERAVELQLRPLFALRGIHELMYQWNARLDAVPDIKDPRGLHIPATSRTPEAFFAHDGEFDPEPYWYLSTIYRRERERGYAGSEDLWMPGVVRWNLSPGNSVHFVCSAEPIDLDAVIAKSQAQMTDAPPVSIVVDAAPTDAALESLHRAANQFRLEVGETNRIALLSGFPWPAPTPRSALIAMTGLLLVPRHFAQARRLLLNLSSYIQRGLIPSEWPEDGSTPVYDGADVSLWYIQALHAYLQYTGDETIVESLLDPLLRIIRSYEGGTDLGIAPDADGLLITHAPNKPTTWMDAQAGDWVITPRQGRPVELSALWYSTLCIIAGLCQRSNRAAIADDLSQRAASVKKAFNKRFWNASANCCFDVVTNHGADSAIRPNQIFAISLPFPVLDEELHRPTLDTVRQMLLTPMGLRTLAPSDPSYQGRYRGDVVSRDRAYHQGSVFPWLLGPYVTASIRTGGGTPDARRHALDALKPCIEWMQDAGLGQLRELFDGNPPHPPGGAIASALSVGEVLRAYVEDVLDQKPVPFKCDSNTPSVKSAPTPSPSGSRSRRGDRGSG